MKCCILIAITAAAWLTAFDTAGANHGEPRPIPQFANPVYVGADGLIHEAVHNSTSADVNWVLGWTFDNDDPSHPWESSSPTVVFDSTSSAFFDRSILFNLYNGSALKLDHLNEAIVHQNPFFDIGPRNISTNDTSTLNVSDSFIGSVFADDESNANITRSSFTGHISMFSNGSMVLNAIAPRERSGFGTDGGVTAGAGTTAISDSIITALTASGTANVSATGGTVNGPVSNLGDSGSPSVTLDGTTLGGISAAIGSVAVTGGDIQSSVSASATGHISVSGGRIGGSASASGTAVLNISGADVQGNLAGDDSSTISMSGGRIGGIVQTTGDATMSLSGLANIGDGNGLAVQTHGHSTINVTGTATIFGSVNADDDSKVNISSVNTILGDVVVGGRVTLELSNTLIAGPINAFGERGTLRMVGGGVGGSAVTFDGGTIELTSVDVNGAMQAFDTAHLIFHSGSHGAQDLKAFDNTNVAVTGGVIDGNLIGLGNSITAMSSGHVAGSPVFLEHATFLYSGGTFGFGIGLGGGTSSLKALAGGAGGEPVDSPPPGFKAMDDAEIQFIGFGLQSHLVDPNFDGGAFSLYQLTGKLADGTVIDGGLVYVQNLSTARFQLIEAPVPEPGGTAFLVAVACSIVANRRRQRR